MGKVRKTKLGRCNPNDNGVSLPTGYLLGGSAAHRFSFAAVQDLDDLE
jgi:hypothetical protein